MDEKYQAAHRYSIHHRKDLEQDETCGCFYCLKIFSPQKIIEWIDHEDTALCPYCGIDSVIGESSGFPITDVFLRGMHRQWF